MVVVLTSLIAVTFVQTREKEPELHSMLLWWLVLSATSVAVFVWWTFVED